MPLSHSRRAVALIASIAVGAVVTLSPVPAAEPAHFSGKVYATDGATSLAGIVIALHDPETDRSYRSNPTTADGTFRVDAVPAGRYAVIAESSDGAFLAAEQVSIEAGSNRPLALTLNGSVPHAQVTSGKGGLPTFHKWLIAGGIAVAGLFVIDEVTTDEDEAASPF